MSVWSLQCTVESTVHCPYHGLNPTLAADTKLVRQQEVTSVGVPDDGLGRQPVDHVPHRKGTETTIQLAQRCEHAGT
jgi:hypothetical protein